MLAVACGESSDDAGDRDAGGGSAAPQTGRLYVTVAGEDEVIVIDEESQEIVRHIPVGAGPAIIVATPDHEQVYTANWEGNSVTAIDVATEETTTIALDDRPYVIAMSPDGAFVYAGVNDNSIAVIDTATKSVTKSFPTDVLPASIVVSPDGETLYVASLNSFLPGKLEALHADDGSVAWESIPVGVAPAWITIGPDGKQVYTLNFLSDDVTVVATTPWSITDVISTGNGSQAIIGNVTPDGSRLYVTNHGTAELMAIDTNSRNVAQTIELDGRPVGVQFNLDGSRVYTTDFGPKSLARAVDTNFLLTGKFSTTDPGQVRIFSTKTGKPIGDAIPTGAGPTSVVFIP
jgi:YVTN family beta-propeller protein